MKFALSELMAMAMDEVKRLACTRRRSWVGALIVNDRGVIVGEGHTQAPGESHAEIAALRRAGAAARGATMIVTLSPVVTWDERALVLRPSSKRHRQGRRGHD